MKNSHVAFWIAVAGAVTFFYSSHQIAVINDDVRAWQAQVEASSSPDMSSTIKAFFDGFTLGALSNGDIFAEQHKYDAIIQQLEATRLQLLKRYQDADYYYKWGAVIGIAGLVAGFWFKKKEARLTT